MIQEMEKLQAKGEVAEEEMRALEIDVTGRVSVIIYAVHALYSLGRFSRRLCWRHGGGQGLRWSKSFEKSAALIYLSAYHSNDVNCVGL